MSADKTDSLFKFTTAPTALQILGSQQLRWSAPERFGDPLELSSQTPLTFDASSMLDSTIKLASSMIFAPEKPKGDSPLINAINRWRDEGRFGSPAEAHNILRELLDKMVSYRVGQLHGNLSKWQIFVRNVRVCCFCAQAQSLASWDQFADCHQGVALRFSVKDIDWGTLRPVIYQPDRPQITTLREQLGAILHNRQDTMVSRFSEHYFIKSAHRKQEVEWRAYKTATRNVPVNDTDSSQWYDDYGFAKETLTAVYFGIGLESAAKQQIATVVKERYSHAKLFQAQLSKTGFSLEFEKVLPTK